MNNKQLENIGNTLLVELLQRYTNGENITKANLEVTFEAQKQCEEKRIENVPITDQEKESLKRKLSKASDATKEYAEELLRCQKRLIE